MKLYNSLSREVEQFTPQDRSCVTMYVCGPTVYSAPHIGNARPAIVFDTLARLLEHYHGIVRYARNVTDIDDKIINIANETGKPAKEVALAAYKAYCIDLDQLHVRLPTHEPFATGAIPDMIEMIKVLEERRHAYVQDDGEVLFHVPSNPHPGIANHGELAGHHRVAQDDKKLDPRDFVLWKPAKPGEPFWESPWGRGRPGWHIECSAMIKRVFSETKTIDIHGGGTDLRFPHHECEMAQSHCANDAPLANYWLHNGLLTVDGEKMSKSLGNIVLVDDVLARVPGESLRFFFLSTHYRSPLDFTWDGLAVAHKTLSSFYKILNDYSDVDNNPLVEAPVEFMKALDHDLNTPGAIAELHQLFKQLATGLNVQQTLAQIRYAGWLLGIFNHSYDSWTHSGVDREEIDRIVQEREQAREQRDWARADALRAQLTDKGVTLEDGPQGTQWRRA